MAALDTAELAIVVASALADSGRTLDDLSASEAVELADALRTTLAALAAPTPRDVRFAATLDAAATLFERRAIAG